MATHRDFTAKELAAWANSKFPEEFRFFCIKLPIEEKIFLPSTPFIQVAGLTIGLDLHCDVLLCVGQRTDYMDSRRWVGRLYVALRKDFTIDFITRDFEDGSFRRLKPSNFGTTYKLYPEYADVLSLDANVEFARNLRNACMYCYLKGGHVSGFYASTHIKMNLFQKMCEGLSGLYNMRSIGHDMNDLALAAADTKLVDKAEAELEKRALEVSLEKANQNVADVRKMRREERRQWRERHMNERRMHGAEIASIRAKHARDIASIRAKHAKEIEEMKALYDFEVERRKRAEQALEQLQQGRLGYYQ